MLNSRREGQHLTMIDYFQAFPVTSNRFVPMLMSLWFVQDPLSWRDFVALCTKCFIKLYDRLGSSLEIGIYHMMLSYLYDILFCLAYLCLFMNKICLKNQMFVVRLLELCMSCCVWSGRYVGVRCDSTYEKFNPQHLIFHPFHKFLV